jgi:hypothetical protein
MPTDALIDVTKVPSLDTIEAEVRAGMPGESARWECATTNEDFYQLRNKSYIERRKAEDDTAFQNRPKRTSHLTRTVIRKLAEPLYNPGPTRTLANSGAVDTWLQGVYADAHINARMQSADRAATLNDVAALQVEATGDPKRPIRVWLWKAHEFAVFCPPDDPLTPWAVCTREIVPDQSRKVRTRYRLWSAAERRTFLTEPFDDARMAGGRRADLMVADESGPTPYPGVLPFSFVRNEPPECKFWDGGIGTALRECNREVDRGLSDIAEHLQTFLNPKGFVSNVALSTRFTDRVDGFIHLRPMPGASEGENKIEPRVWYLQATLGVQEAWYDLRAYSDQTLEELDVPLTTVRTDSSTDLSGIAIVAKTLPLLNRTRNRQPQFTEAETDLAGKALAVGGVWYRQATLTAAARDPRLMLVWPEPSFPLPTPERDAGDEFELAQGLADPIEVLAKRRGLTIDQAEELARQIARRRQLWTDLFTPAAPAVATPPAQEIAGTNQGQEPEPTDFNLGTPETTADGQQQQ